MKVWWLGFALVTSQLVAQGEFSRVDTLLLAPEVYVGGVGWGDFDGDGRRDLLLATRTGENFLDRKVQIHLQNATTGRFSSEPDRSLDLPEDLSCLAAGDLHPDVGDEVLLLGARSTVVWRWRQEGRERFVPVAKTGLLWQRTWHGRTIFWPDALRDFDGDGLVDVLVPEHEVFRVLRQVRDGEGVRFVPAGLPGTPRTTAGAAAGKEPREVAKQRRFEFRLKLPIAGVGRAEPLLELFESAPKPNYLDFDGDGLLDLIGRDEVEVFVWLQGPRGVFPDAPSLRLEAPVQVDRGRLIDTSYATHFLDLDQDRRADCVLLAADRRAESARTQVLVFRAAATTKGEPPLFGSKGIPSSLMVVGGFVGGAHFVDADGDGDQDLVLGSFRPDLLDSIVTQSNAKIDVEAYVYLNEQGSFRREPDWRFTVSLELEGTGAFDGDLVARLVEDVTGDGLADLLLRDRPGRLRLFDLRRNAEGAVEPRDRPLFELPIDEDAEIEVLPRFPGGPVSVIVREDRKIHFLRLGR